MKKLILSFYVCCSFASFAGADDLWAANGCHMAEIRCNNVKSECDRARDKANANMINNFRNAPVEPYELREADRSKNEENRVCANANNVCTESARICAEERRREQERRNRDNLGFGLDL